jgi:hypothetical protein
MLFTQLFGPAGILTEYSIGRGASPSSSDTLPTSDEQPKSKMLNKYANCFVQIVANFPVYPLNGFRRFE